MGTWGMVGLDLLNNEHTFWLLSAKSESGPGNDGEHLNLLSLFWGTWTLGRETLAEREWI